MKPITFDFKDTFSKISGIAREREYKGYKESGESGESGFTENYDLFKEYEKDLEEFKNRFSTSIYEELTREQRKEFVTILKTTPDDIFVEKAAKLGEELNLNEDEKNIFTEILMVMKEQKGTFEDFLDDLEDLILDIKKSAYDLVLEIAEFVDERPELKGAAFVSIIVSFNIILTFIAILIVQDKGEKEIMKKINDVI